MPTKRVCVGVVRVELDSSIEEFESVFVFFLKRETISNSNPCLWRENILLQCEMSQVAELDWFFELPQTGAIVLNALESIRFHLLCLLEIFFSFMVSDNLHVATPDKIQNVACIVMVEG